MQQTWHSSLSSFASELAQVHSSKSYFSQMDPAHCWGRNRLEMFYLIKLRMKPYKIVKWMWWLILNFTMFALFFPTNKKSVWLHKAEPGKGKEFASPLCLPRTQFRPSTADVRTKLWMTGGFLLQRVFGAKSLLDWPQTNGGFVSKTVSTNILVIDLQRKRKGLLFLAVQERQLQRVNRKQQRHPLET